MYRELNSVDCDNTDNDSVIRKRQPSGGC